MAGSAVAGPVRQSYVIVNVSQLCPGSRLQSPIFEDREDQNILLLAAGTTITTGLLEKLRQRGITNVRIDAREAARLTGTNAPGRRSLFRDSAASYFSSRYNTPESEAWLNRVRAPGSTTFDIQRVESFWRKYDDSVQQIQHLIDALTRGRTPDGTVVRTVSADSLVQMAEDLDLFVTLGITPQIDKYPYRHSLQTSMLAMAIGAIMGLHEEALMEMGMGCLIHDAGMLKLNRRVFESKHDLDAIQFLEITKHPMHTFELVRHMHELPIGARMVAYQMHERWNGSGYPCGRQGKRIHLLARIAAVADVYVALISARPHRPGMLPCHAMEHVLRGVARGYFDPEVVRAFLQTVSLFPLGSFVEMNDGRVGKVVRANREEYTRPVVELWTPNNINTAPELVDLTKIPELNVQRPLAGLHRGLVRRPAIAG